MSCVADAVAAMFLAWNATDEVSIRQHAFAALTPDVEFVDPDYHVRGIDEWVEMVLTFRAGNPQARPRLASRVDVHHDRGRYAWSVTLKDGEVLEGIDVIAYDGEACRIRRIDSFIGRLVADPE